MRSLREPAVREELLARFGRLRPDLPWPKGAPTAPEFVHAGPAVLEFGV